jgi:hypothetical protein
MVRASEIIERGAGAAQDEVGAVLEDVCIAARGEKRSRG